MNSERKDLPIFPLGGVVLFPGSPLVIRVFEERYKRLVADVESIDSRIGIVLIKEGNEVGDTAEPFQVGTQAKIVESTRMENGQIFLSLLGEQVFRINQIVTEYPYQIANVEIINELLDPGISDGYVISVTEAFQEYLKIARFLEGSWSGQIVNEPDPVKLSYLIAQIMSAEPLVKQGLLETFGAGERLEIEENLLRKGTERLKHRLLYQGPQSRFGKN